MSSESIKEAEVYAREHCEDFITELRKLRKRCMDYEQMISAMEKGTCSACKETAKDELLEELKSELEHKKLAIKSRNVRIANLKNTLNGTYMSLERRKRKLSQARNIIKALCKYITPDSNWTELERAEQVELLQQAEDFLKETEE